MTTPTEAERVAMADKAMKAMSLSSRRDSRLFNHSKTNGKQG